jgi:pyrroline-5-carboxylate reductase
MNFTASKSEGAHSNLRSNGGLAVLGCGKMGTILLQAFLQKGLVSRESVIATVQHEERAKAIAKQMGITVGVDNRAAVSGASTVLVCVKPQTMSQLLDEISPALKADALVISIVASAPVKFIQQRLGNNKAVLRAMPNTPASVGAAMTAIATGSHAGPAHLELAKQMFESIGRVAVVDEKHMDAVTALSASGPAFVFVILESMAEAGVKVGLPRELATLLAAQTLFGSAQLALQTGHHPALLKDAVTTPAGCTIDGIMELEKGGLRVTIMSAIVKATQRARELMSEPVSS